MSNPLVKNRSNTFRVIVYPMALVALGVLVFLGWVHQPQPDIRQRLSSANMLAQSGAFDLANVELAAIFKEEPDNRHAWLIKGYMDERSGDEANAIECYRAALKVTDEADLQRDIRLSIADLFRRLESPEDALRELAEVESAAGESVQTQRLRGIIAWDEGKFSEARGHFLDAKKIDPGNAEMDSLAAGTLIEESKFDQAYAALEKIPAEESSAWPYWQALARSCMESGYGVNAKVALSKYVQLDQQGKARLQKDEFWQRHASDAGLSGLWND